MAPITLALGLLMISRVPYPSFKTMSVHKPAPIELTIGVLMAAAMLFALPQLTAFILATAFVLSGPFLMLRGEEMQPKVPLLHPVHASKSKDSANGKIGDAHNEADHHHMCYGDACWGIWMRRVIRVCLIASCATLAMTFS